MGAHPKRKISKMRRDSRRGHHALEFPQFITCPSCRQLTLPHQACHRCGVYRGRQVVEMNNERAAR
ncbi:MAG: 50S ribosomal protein L32 [Chloroflexi bacterium]|nr:50S ribosomal protein L32 [Chloroflexota bacterium]